MIVKKVLIKKPIIMLKNVEVPAKKWEV